VAGAIYVKEDAKSKFPLFVRYHQSQLIGADGFLVNLSETVQADPDFDFEEQK